MILVNYSNYYIFCFLEVIDFEQDKKDRSRVFGEIQRKMPFLPIEMKMCLFY